MYLDATIISPILQSTIMQITTRISRKDYVKSTYVV